MGGRAGVEAAAMVAAAALARRARARGAEMTARAAREGEEMALEGVVAARGWGWGRAGLSLTRGVQAPRPRRLTWQ
jgi:hypothetical protein